MNVDSISGKDSHLYDYIAKAFKIASSTFSNPFMAVINEFIYFLLLLLLDDDTIVNNFLF